MSSRATFAAACLLAAFVPLLPLPARLEEAPPIVRFPGWPTLLDGRRLTPRALAPGDARWAASFPGRTAAFDDGTREVVLRYVERATRRLHPAEHCYRATGWEVTPRPLRVDAEGRAWGCFEASRDGQRRLVLESIVDARGRAFSDVSSWFWAAALGRSDGPFWVTTVVEPLD